MIKGRYFLVAGKYGIIRSYGMVEPSGVREVVRVSGVSFLSFEIRGARAPSRTRSSGDFRVQPMREKVRTQYISVRIPKLAVGNPQTVFLLFVALNAMGYDEENNSRGMSAARKKVRGVVAGRNWDGKYPSLKRAVKTYGPWRLLRTILTHREDARRPPTLINFSTELRELSREPSIQKLRKLFKAYQVAEAKKLSPLFRRETARLITFLGQSPRGVKKIVLIANPLDAYWRGYGLTIGRIGYIVVGPGAEKDFGELIRHELLHILAPSLRFPVLTATGKNYRQLAAMGYGNPRIIEREYVVRGLNLLYRAAVLKRDISDAVRREQKHFPRIREAMALVRMKMKKGRR